MVRIVEVGPRDGLQNESTPIPTDIKLRFIRDLVEAGLTEIEVSSFVSPKWVPQLADAAEVFSELALSPPHPPIHSSPQFSALVPNLKGLERALECGVSRIALFTAASDAFTQKNINMTVAQSLDVFRQVVEAFRGARPDGHVRAYISTAFECPYAGRIEPKATANIARALEDDLAVDEISLGDTIGAAVPSEVEILHEHVALYVPQAKVAWHFHDTRGTAIANVAKALELGYKAFDSSAGGLGGCPYAPGAGGNLATEDLVYFLERSGIGTGISLEKLARASLPALEALGRKPASKAQVATLAG
ncbi:MAG TPA: hydroxymethylglutaryl-CoA lyase [Fimbriimonadaceae bacterium]|nr:hydroxymethylglutaryl-CoA lyase [Fimbriimonadaceae bacterium]